MNRTQLILIACIVACVAAFAGIEVYSRNKKGTVVKLFTYNYTYTA